MWVEFKTTPCASTVRCEHLFIVLVLIMGVASVLLCLQVHRFCSIERALHILSVPVPWCPERQIPKGKNSIMPHSHSVHVDDCYKFNVGYDRQEIRGARKEEKKGSKEGTSKYKR